jgi:hypothetical protein
MPMPAFRKNVPKNSTQRTIKPQQDLIMSRQGDVVDSLMILL